MIIVVLPIRSNTTKGFYWIVPVPLLFPVQVAKKIYLYFLEVGKRSRRYCIWKEGKDENNFFIIYHSYYQILEYLETNVMKPMGAVSGSSTKRYHHQALEDL